MEYLGSNQDSIYYIFYCFNKTILNKNDLLILSKLGYCHNCLIEISKKEINYNDIKYIESKDWDKFLECFPKELNVCTCTKCECGLNKCIEVIHDLFDYEDKYPIYRLNCTRCESLRIPTYDKSLIKNNKQIIEQENLKLDNNKYNHNIRISNSNNIVFE